jgi:hypothetical protein
LVVLIPGLAQTSFTKITEGPVVTDLSLSALCPAWGDLNNDGHVDLVVVGEGAFNSIDDYQRDAVMVYLNDQHGSFRRATEVDIGALATTALSGTPISLADYDNDGCLDVYLYEGLDPNPEKAAYLYHGGADGRFTLVSEDVGINRPLVPWTEWGYLGPWGISWVDYDQDGFLDVALADYLSDSGRLWRNNGNGTFSRVLTNVFRGITDSHFGCWSDYDNDGDLDLHAQTGLGENDGAGQFIRKTGPSYPGLGPANWVDYDNDGHLDYFTFWGLDPRRRVLMRNNRDGTFAEVTIDPLTTDPASEGASAWADYNNDGFLDVVACSRTSGKPNDLYRNDGNGNRWILLRLVGTVSNRSAIGAKVRAQATIWGQNAQQMREVSGTPFTGDLRAHFGLGDATNVTTLRIEWPSGIVQELTNVAASQILTITEPAQLVPLGPREFQIQCWNGMKFEVEKSHNLQTWDSLGVVANEAGTLTFQGAQGDPQAAGCFYRVVSR